MRRWRTDLFWSRIHRTRPLPTWMEDPLVRRRINRRISGSEHTWPVDHFRRGLSGRVFERGLSLGCGTGALERDVFGKGICRSITGFDLSEAALETARREARAQGLAGITYRAADLDDLDPRAADLAAGTYDIVFCHQSLHHVSRLEACLDVVRTILAPGGLLYVDEYVGPSRGQWSRALMAEADRAYAELPPDVRGPRTMGLPVDRRDPSEAIRSSEIVGAIESRFAVVERRDYGGNLLASIYPNLRLGPPRESEMRTRILGGLLDREDELLSAGARSFYTLLLARPR